MGSFFPINLTFHYLFSPLLPTASKDELKPRDAVQDDLLNDTVENLKKTSKKNEEKIVLADTGKNMDASHVSLEMGESDTQSHLEAGLTVKKKRKSKKLKTNSQDVGEEIAHELVSEECHGEQNTDSSNVVMKQKCFQAMSGVGSIQTSTDVKALGQSSADHKSELTSLVDIPVEAGQAERGISLVKRKIKKKKMNVEEEKMDAETGEGQILEKIGEEIPLRNQLETTETEADKTKSQGGDPGQLKSSTLVRKKKRKSEKLCSSLQDIGEEVVVQSLSKEHDEIRKLSTIQKMGEDNHAPQSQLGTSTTQKKKVKKSCLQEVAVKSTAIMVETDKHNEDDEISRHQCPVPCRLKASTTKKKKKNKKLMSSSTSQDSCAELIAVDKAPTVDLMSAEAQPLEALVVGMTSRKKKAKEETGSKHQVDLEVKEPELSSDSTHITTNENKGDTAESYQPKSVKKAKKKRELSLHEEDPVPEPENQPAVQSASTKHTPWKKKKIEKKQSQSTEESKEQRSLKKTVKEKAETEVPDNVPSDSICTLEINSLTPIKKVKKKRKLQTDEAETSQNNGQAEEEKKVKSSVSLDILLWYCISVQLSHLLTSYVYMPFCDESFSLFIGNRSLRFPHH